MPDLQAMPAALRLEKDAYEDALSELQSELAKIQTAWIGTGRRAIIVTEGWDAAGKGGFIRRLTAPWDPRFFDVIPIAAPSEEAKEHHFLWRFWRQLPGAGEVNIFDRSWYGRVLVERVEGFASEAAWQRSYAEINQFEAMLQADGAVLIKLFFHVTQETQDERLKDRLAQPWKRWKLSVEDFRNRKKRSAYEAAIADMFAKTHSSDAPWHLIDGNHKKTARIAAMRIVAEKLSAGLDLSEPPLDPEIAVLARETFGIKAE